MRRAGLRRRYGERPKRNPSRISERAGKAPVMAAFRPDDAKPLGADALSPVHTSDAVEPPTVGGTHFDAYEYLTGSYSGV